MVDPVTEPAVPPPTPATELSSPKEAVGGWLQTLRTGDIGSLPIIIGLILIVIVFQSLNPTFLNAFNLVNLCLQIAALGIMATGITLVLMLGEIDLSIGSVSGLAAAVLLVTHVNHGYAPLLAVLVAVLVGTLVGLIQGSIFAKIGVPSFIVTLAGLLIWQGVQLRVLGEQGTINLPPAGTLVRWAQFSFVPRWLAITLAALAPLLYLLLSLLTRRRRAAAELPVTPLWLPIAVAVILLVLLQLVVAKLYLDRGVPWTFVFMVLVVVFFDWLLRRTAYGRKIFAVGGNIEAARRAGINVDWIRISVFALCSTLAAVSGVVAAMRLGFANQQSGSGETLINAIAAAVIGGTSLFGGRTRRYAPLLGALVIGSIANGLELLSLSSDVRLIVTGTVLLAAVVIDALVQRSRTSHGR
ncbi:ABC transporter permease [Catellatospora chokoriensis]|uniref:Xylose transport system permease protein XylH n=2 Tax=Catellatospora TaxID=53365 RepID=A0A8J3NWR8_9ACTN|nr:D-xylose transport system permease protein [Catellatospora citrea]GIF87473.1 ABC transporter permease [Catellatospora chokoriensis]GIF95605.1 ABC transporter permease [Catellatospora citrea]